MSEIRDGWSEHDQQRYSEGTDIRAAVQAVSQSTVDPAHCLVGRVLTVARPEPDDRPAWESLFRAYIAFYERSEPQTMYDRAWDEFSRDDRMHALGAKVNGQLVGFAHFLEHPSTSSADACYLQDLFTAPEARGQGVGRALIEAVAEHARQLGCARVYWQTKTTNAVARRLYDSITEDSSFTVYRLPL
jgi:GNAT superfamily N-acetyltransferase